MAVETDLRAVIAPLGFPVETWTCCSAIPYSRVPCHPGHVEMRRLPAQVGDALPQRSQQIELNAHQPLYASQIFVDQIPQLILAGILGRVPGIEF